MKAIVIHEFGEPEVLKLQEIDKPKPGPGQLLVNIHAAGVNPADTYTRSGNYAVKPKLPFTPGTDGAGVIDSIGEGVTKFKPGDRVYVARSISGTYAEYALTLETQVYSLPEHVSFSQGAGVWVPCGTAFHALHHHAHAHPGESILIHGASGGVGIAAVQLVKALGLTILGTAGTDKGRELVKKEGAHFVFNHSQQGYQDEILKATNGQGVNIILEMLANVNLAADLKLIATNGRIIVIGSRGDITITPRELMSRRGSIHAFTLWAITENEAKEVHAGLIASLENKTLRPVIRKEIPLSEAALAQKQVMEPGAYGKIVLIP